MLNPKNNTLTDVLSSLNLSHCSAGDCGRMGEHHVRDDSGAILFTGTAYDVWRWLRDTERLIGAIPGEWWHNALKNADLQTVKSWFVAATNDPDLSIDRGLAVYCRGAWLCQSRIDELCRQIDAGV